MRLAPIMNSTRLSCTQQHYIYTHLILNDHSCSSCWLWWFRCLLQMHTYVIYDFVYWSIKTSVSQNKSNHVNLYPLKTHLIWTPWKDKWAWPTSSNYFKNINDVHSHNTRGSFTNQSCSVQIWLKRGITFVLLLCHKNVECPTNNHKKLNPYSPSEAL